MTDLAADLAFNLGGNAVTKTLADIIAIVRFRGDLRNTIRFPDANLTTEIQAAFAEWYELVVRTNEGYFDTRDIAITTSGSDFVALPDGTWRVRAVDRLDGTDYVNVPRVGVKDRNRFGSRTGKPLGHRLTNRGIDLYPTPDAAYTLRITFTPVAPTLDTTARNFFNSWEEYTVFGALVRLYLNQNRDASQWQQQLQIQAARIIDSASERDSSGPEYIALHDHSPADEYDIPPTWSW